MYRTEGVKNMSVMKLVVEYNAWANWARGIVLLANLPEGTGV